MPAWNENTERRNVRVPVARTARRVPVSNGAWSSAASATFSPYGKATERSNCSEGVFPPLNEPSR